MRKLAIAINDFLFKILLVLVAIINFFIAPNVSTFVGYMIITCVLWAIFSGFWFAISGIYHELVKLNARADKAANVSPEKEPFL